MQCTRAQITGSVAATRNNSYEHELGHPALTVASAAITTVRILVCAREKKEREEERATELRLRASRLDAGRALMGEGRAEIIKGGR